VRMRKNRELDEMFEKNKFFTIIYVMNYIDSYMIERSDVIFLAKETNIEQIKYYYNRIKYFFTNFCSLDWLIYSMDELDKYGFVSLSKNDVCTREELYIKA